MLDRMEKVARENLRVAEACECLLAIEACADGGAPGRHEGLHGSVGLQGAVGLQGSVGIRLVDGNCMF